MANIHVFGCSRNKNSKVILIVGGFSRPNVIHSTTPSNEYEAQEFSAFTLIIVGDRNLIGGDDGTSSHCQIAARKILFIHNDQSSWIGWKRQAWQ